MLKNIARAGALASAASAVSVAGAQVARRRAGAGVGGTLQLQLRRSVGTRWDPGARGDARPLATTLFVLGAVPAAFIGCAVWDRYRQLHGLSTTLAQRVRSTRWPPVFEAISRRPQDTGAILRAWFRQLPEGSRLTLGVIAANVAVFAAWRVPALHVFMRRNFVHPENGKRLRTILTAGFSHMGGFHLLANMYGLYLFMPLAASVLGAPETLFVYTSGIVLSAYVSTMVRLLVGMPMVASLGASGGVMTMIAVAAKVRPDVQYNILFLPSISFGGDRLILGTAAIDVALMMSGRTSIDHFAHLGGLAAGYAYIAADVRRVWRARFTTLGPVLPVIDGLIGPSPKARPSPTSRPRF